MRVLMTSALLAGALLVAGPAGAAANLVANPGFETGDFSGWIVTVGGSGSDVDLGVDQYAADVDSGSWGAFLGNADTSAITQVIATTPGATYRVSFELDVYQSQAFDGGLSVSLGGHPVVTLVEPAETDSFVEYSAVVTASAGASQLVFSGSDPGGWFGLDDVSVTQLSSPIPEPTTGALAIAGLALVAGAARRRSRRGD